MAVATTDMVELALSERTHNSTLGTSRQASYAIRYTGGLTAAANVAYYEFTQGIPAGYRVSAASEELALQLAVERDGKDSRQAELFGELFARQNGDIPYTWQWTSTGLRVPEGMTNQSRPDYRDEQGRQYWLREVLIGSRVVGEAYVPEGNGRLVAEWDEVFGIPAVTTEDQPYPHEPYTTHFWFEPNPPIDRVSGARDVAVGRDARWPTTHRRRCLVLGADYGRGSSGFADAYRLVSGDLVPPTFEGTEATTQGRSRSEFLEELRSDWAAMPARTFVEKYRLEEAE